MAERIVFDRSLYLPEAVTAAASAYADHARIEVSAGDNETTAEIGDTGDYDSTTIARAFANHVLHETIARRQQAALDEI
jgi:hypothetical protein